MVVFSDKPNELQGILKTTQFQTKKPCGFEINSKLNEFWQGQARGIWTYHLPKFEIWQYHEGPTRQSRITQKWLELSLSFFHII